MKNPLILTMYKHNLNFQVIEQHGGQVDVSYSSRVTHILCANQQSDVFVVVSHHFTVNHVQHKILVNVMIPHKMLIFHDTKLKKH